MRSHDLSSVEKHRLVLNWLRRRGAAVSQHFPINHALTEALEESGVTPADTLWSNIDLAIQLIDQEGQT